MPPSPNEREALAEQYKPLLVLYPEIGTEARALRADWREAVMPPLEQDYHPRDVNLVLDHSRIGGKPVHDRGGLIEAMKSNAARRIDILAGIGHADRDKFWAEYYRITQNKDGHDHSAYPHSAYVNVVDGETVAAEKPDSEFLALFRELIAIEYWFIYLYNDWRSTHEGDWELVVVFLRKPSEPGGQHEPVACAFSAHHGGFRLPWGEVEKVDGERQRSDGGSHPVVYVANGSHANYFHGPGRYATSTKLFGLRVTAGEFPFSGDFVDFTTAYRPEAAVFPQVKLVPQPVNGAWADDEWQWLNFRGEWGSQGVPRWLRWIPRPIRFRLLRRVWGAPASLPVRRNWRDPFAWADRECEEAPANSWLAQQ